jgi:hypothetical protein
MTTSGSARSSTRMRRSGSADLLASRGRGMSDAEAARTLRRLGQAVPDLDVSVPQAIAAHVRLHPEWTDIEVARRIRGCDDPALVALVRGNLAAGHPPDRGITPGSPPDRPREPSRASQPPARPPADVPPAPPQRRHSAAESPGRGLPPLGPPHAPQPPLDCDAWRAGMPTYVVVDLGGAVHHAASYMEARRIRARVGGSVRAVPRG